jgi:hypothetical protein
MPVGVDSVLTARPTATTPGLALRPWAEQDIPAMVAAHRDPARGRGIAARAVDVVCDWAFRLPRRRPLEQLELLHSVGNHASCRVAEKANFIFSAVLPPLLPDFPDDGHLHIRRAGSCPQQ